jgi:exoribonuclease-2
MSHALSNHRASLSTIAAWAMFSRGLEPEFPPAALRQLAGFDGPAVESDRGIRDLSILPGARSTTTTPAIWIS